MRACLEGGIDRFSSLLRIVLSKSFRIVLGFGQALRRQNEEVRLIVGRFGKCQKRPEQACSGSLDFHIKCRGSAERVRHPIGHRQDIDGDGYA